MENTNPNNPYAFAFLSPQDKIMNEGMTLRDYFANSAMQGHWASEYNIGHCSSENMESLAEQFYRMSDAMLKQRSL